VTTLFQADFEASSIRQGVTYLSTLDPDLRIFGASSHKYRLNQPASVRAVLDIEQSNRIGLPSDYRDFMLTASNGGAGPNYGIKSIADILRGCDPSKPFELNESCARDREFGMIWLTDNGCATTTNLVVNCADNYGRVCEMYCEDDRIEIGGTFRSWYLDWLNGAIRMLSKEPFTRSIKKGMKLDDVRGLLGSELIPHDPRATLLDDYALAFQDINGFVKFNFLDRVVATNFSTHCLLPRWNKQSE
jgi:hypothetical protein